MNQRLWQYPDTVLRKILFGIGFLLFWLCAPILFLCGVFWWKQNSLFVIIHLQALFYNPWLFK